MYHDLADAFEMKMHICWTKDGKQIKLKTWGGEQFSRTTVWKFLEVPSMQPLYSKRLEKEMCRSVSSHHGADTRLLDMLAGYHAVIHATH